MYNINSGFDEGIQDQWELDVSIGHVLVGEW